jgi:cold shock CspA family protein
MTEQERCRYQRRYGLKERQQGRVKTINAERGYMFIAGDDGTDILLHRSKIASYSITSSAHASSVGGPSALARIWPVGFFRLNASYPIKNLQSGH